MAEAGRSSGRFGFTNVNVRQFVAALMMIDDDDRHARRRASVEAKLVVPQSTVTSSVAPLPRACARPRHWGRSLRNRSGMDQRIEPVAQVPCQRRRGRAVDVVIAKDGDALFG